MSPFYCFVIAFQNTSPYSHWPLQAHTSIGAPDHLQGRRAKVLSLLPSAPTLSVMFWAPAAPGIQDAWRPWQLYAGCLQTHGTQRVRDQEKSISYIVYQGMLSAAARLVARVCIYRDMSTKMNGMIVLSMIDRSSDARMSFKHCNPSFCSPVAAVPDP